jgi:hypothetical protein
MLPHLSSGRVAREGDTGAGALAAIAKYHGLHIHIIKESQRGDEQ